MALLKIRKVKNHLYVYKVLAEKPKRKEEVLARLDDVLTLLKKWGLVDGKTFA